MVVLDVDDVLTVDESPEPPGLITPAECISFIIRIDGVDSEAAAGLAHASPSSSIAMDIDDISASFSRWVSEAHGF